MRLSKCVRLNMPLHSQQLHSHAGPRCERLRICDEGALKGARKATTSVPARLPGHAPGLARGVRC